MNFEKGVVEFGAFRLRMMKGGDVRAEGIFRESGAGGADVPGVWARADRGCGIYLG